MPYRGRVVKRVKGQRKMKPLNPVAKFTFTKTYQVSKGSATDNCYILQVDASTPFTPISVKNGQWLASTIDQEPIGLSSDLYSHYNHLVVLGCHVSASVVDNVDASSLEDENISLGQITIVRASADNQIAASTTGPELKQYYGQKTRDFTLHAAELSKTALQKSAYVSNGYSAKKTWNCNPNVNDDLRVRNLSGSSNTPNDSSYLNVCLCPRFLNPTNFLEPMVVTVRMSYIIQFQEPTITQTVPLPINTGESRSKREQSNYEYIKSSARAMYQGAPSMSQINRAVRQAQDAIYMLNAIKRRQRALRN